MATPDGRDLFLTCWHLFLSENENTTNRPGGSGWDDNRTRQLNYWTKIWFDCRELAELMASRNESMDEIRSQFKSDTWGSQDDGNDP